MAKAKEEVVLEVGDAAAPTAPSFAASTSNIAYDKAASQPMGALCTGMGYAPDVAPTTTTATQYIGGAAETIGYSLPSK